MRRIRKERNLKPSKPLLFGGGQTEYYYFLHLKHLQGYRVEIKPRFFVSDTAEEIEKYIQKCLFENRDAICVYDKDVTQWNEHQLAKFNEIEAKYKNHKNILLCGSLPSIEYWFLIHFENAKRLFRTSREVITKLHKYIPRYAKSEKFLKNMAWVDLLLRNDGLNKACSRASKTTICDSSYTDIYKVIEKLEKNEEKIADVEKKL